MKIHEATEELTKVRNALGWAFDYQCKKAEGNAATHMSPTVIYPPIVGALNDAVQAIERVLTALEGGPIEKGDEDGCG